MWDEPYLETCCRAALHRLLLAGSAGRPAGGPAGEPTGLMDGGCLERLTRMGLACERSDGRFSVTAAGLDRHLREVAKRPSDGLMPKGFTP